MYGDDWFWYIPSQYWLAEVMVQVRGDILISSATLFILFLLWMQLLIIKGVPQGFVSGPLVASSTHVVKGFLALLWWHSDKIFFKTWRARQDFLLSFNTVTQLDAERHSAVVIARSWNLFLQSLLIKFPPAALRNAASVETLRVVVWLIPPSDKQGQTHWTSNIPNHL